MDLRAGTVLLDGKPVKGPSSEISMIFQEATLLPWRDLDANIHFPFEIKGTRPDRAWIDELLHKVGLEGFGRRSRASCPAACSSAPPWSGPCRSSRPSC